MNLAGMMTPPAVTGIATLLLLTLLALAAILMVIAGLQDGRSRRRAWIRIGAERRALHDHRQLLDGREAAQDQQAWELTMRERDLEAREHGLLATRESRSPGAGP